LPESNYRAPPTYSRRPRTFISARRASHNDGSARHTDGERIGLPHIDLVLLDEPTASLDPATEAIVYDNLFAAFADACIVSSMHRLNLLERFDEVLVMQNGRLVAQGPPALLALDCAELQRLTAAQQRARLDAASGESAAVA
jgi:ABC-type transport system involved in cytochrome bd biosynthesis fused ATPase/permease subunit